MQVLDLPRISCRREVGKIGSMPLAGMDDEEAGIAPRLEQSAVRFDRAPKLRDVVAKHFAEAARLEKIPLHVDDDEARTRWIEFKLIGFCPN